MHEDKPPIDKDFEKKSVVYRWLFILEKIKKHFKRCKTLAPLRIRLQPRKRQRSKDKLSLFERRQAILEALNERRQDSIANLAFEFQVSIRTIKYDIQELSLSFPIYTVQGKGGGVYVMDGFKLGRKYMSDKETAVVKKMIKTATGEELTTLKSILKEFGKK